MSLTKKKSDKEVLKELIPDCGDMAIDVLIDISKRLHKLNEKYCNEPFTKEDKEDLESIEKAIKSFSEKYHVDITLNYDPRGYPVRILNNKYINSWHGDGYGIGLI